jgi:hypothetical protein
MSKTINALLSIATCVRYAKKTPPDSGHTWYAGMDNLQVALNEYKPLFLQLANSERTKLDNTFCKVYMKGMDIMLENDSKANEQIDKQISERKLFIGYSDSFFKNANYEYVNELLDNLIDFEDDGGFKILKKNMDEIQFEIFKSGAKAFASHVLNNKYLLALSYHDDLITHIENVETNYNHKKLRKFLDKNGNVPNRKAALSKMFVSVRLENPPEDATKTIAPTDTKTTELIPTYKPTKKKKSKKAEVKWYCPIDKKELEPTPKKPYVWVDLREPLKPYVPQYTHIETNKIKKNKYYYDVRIADRLEY